MNYSTTEEMLLALGGQIKVELMLARRKVAIALVNEAFAQQQKGELTLNAYDAIRQIAATVAPDYTEGGSL